MKNSVRTGLLALSAAAALAPTVASAGWSGNIGVFSQYVLRGYTPVPESSGAVLQGGFDYESDTGLYAGYWGSSLDYTNPEDDPELGTGFENDFYAGYAGSVAGLDYSVGLIYYYYIGVEDADAPEIAASVGYGPFSVGLNYLLDDVIWGNSGDVYLTASYGTDLPADFAFGATLGYYLYEEDGDFIAPATTTQDNAFRHLTLTLAHPVAETGAEMSVSYIIGGEWRDESDLGDTVVLGLSYGFDI